MKIINASAEILNPYEGKIPLKEYLVSQLKHIEKVGRTCYKSENRITSNSYESFIRMLINKGHEAMLEHGTLSVRFIVDRGISHEIVRHRIASFAQESTRYVCYGENKRGGELTFINPFNIIETDNENAEEEWMNVCYEAEEKYLSMINSGVQPQIARNVLPTSVKTELVMTANFREWRSFFKLRCDKAAHPQMRDVVIPILFELKLLIPVMFEDINVEY